MRYAMTCVTVAAPSVRCGTSHIYTKRRTLETRQVIRNAVLQRSLISNLRISLYSEPSNLQAPSEPISLRTNVSWDHRDYGVVLMVDAAGSTLRKSHFIVVQVDMTPSMATVGSAGTVKLDLLYQEARASCY